jgi:hypothetical protein
MATAKPAHRAIRGLGTAMLVAALALAGVLAWYWRPLTAQARAGAAFGARIGCSCHYVAGRQLSDCRRDFESGMAVVVLSDDDAAKSVTARVPLIASDTARLVPGQGCRLDPAGRQRF